MSMRPTFHCNKHKVTYTHRCVLCLAASLVEPAAPLQPPSEAAYQFEVWLGDEFCASGDAPSIEAMRAEASRYAAQYAQDGPIDVREFVRYPLAAAPAQPAAQPEQFKPSGKCTCAGPDGPCDGCVANREAYEEWQAERSQPTAQPEPQAAPAGVREKAIRKALEAMRDVAWDEEGYMLEPDLAEAHDELVAALAAPAQAPQDDLRDSINAMLGAVGYPMEELAQRYPKEKVSVTFKRWFDEQTAAPAQAQAEAHSKDQQ
jgi:hypothetical protein